MVAKIKIRFLFAGMMFIILTRWPASPYTYAQTTDWDQIRAVAWHPNGTMIAADTGDGISILNSSLTLITHLATPIGYIPDALAFSPNGALLATSSGYQPTETIVWETTTWNEVSASPFGGTLEMADNFVIDWSPDSTRLVIPQASFESPIISVLDVWTGERTLLFKKHTSFPNAADWSPDGTKIATTATDSTIRIWDTKTATELNVIHVPPPPQIAPLPDLAWSPDGSRIAVTALEREGKIRIVDANTGETVGVLETPGHVPVNVVWNGEYLFATGENTTLRYSQIVVWNPDTAEVLGSLRIADWHYFDVTLDGEQILYTTEGETGDTLNIVATDSLLPTNTLGNRIWLDANGNGIQDAGEMGIAGLTVHLLNNNFGIVQTVQTNAYGFYTFADPVPATNYYIQIIPPPTHTPSPRVIAARMIPATPISTGAITPLLPTPPTASSFRRSLSRPRVCSAMMSTPG